ncbi:hypothetical protein ILUMI_10090 [Ignelater luminosus]|uniref:CLIP domain-containing serine protease n=1 Tax=Ignelater luminosus TaxID=2038154 RepID=A0A8K0D4K4_IGNLU|nr:hypothetical protein ILUMI_10090 [Ignelater luminosus]
MFLLVYVAYAFLAFASAQGNGKPCVTPNGENATCIPIDSCPVIKRALAYLNPEAVEFAQKSQCGYDDGPLVCCGSVGRITTPAPPVTEFIPKETFILELPPAAPINNKILPDLTLCGIQLGGKRNGKIAEIEEHPWLVALYYTNNDNKSGEFKCSGVLINQVYVLTSADCVEIQGYTLEFVRLGESKFSSNDEHIRKNPDQTSEPIEEVRIAKATTHPYYNRRKGNNNIALLRLERKISYSDYVRAICLPPNDFPHPVPNTIMEAVGWSLTEDGKQSDVKLKANITLLTFEECQAKFENYTKRFYPGRICAKSTNNAPLCNGESGVPLLVPYKLPNTAEILEDQWYLEGLTLKGFGCARPGEPGLYMRLSRYVSWIINNIRP